MNDDGLGVDDEGGGVNDDGLDVDDDGLGVDDEGGGVDDDGLGVDDDGLGVSVAGIGVHDDGLGVSDDGLGVHDDGLGVGGTRDRIRISRKGAKSRKDRQDFFLLRALGEPLRLCVKFCSPRSSRRRWRSDEACRLSTARRR